MRRILSRKLKHHLKETQNSDSGLLTLLEIIAMHYLLVHLKIRENALNDAVSAICPNVQEPMQHFPQNGNSLCACETADSLQSLTETSAFALRLKLWTSDIKSHSALSRETLKSACLRTFKYSSVCLII